MYFYCIFGFDFVKENGLSVKYIVLTHSHFDHAHYVGEYRELLPEAKLCIHKDEAPLMNDPEANVSYLFSSSERYGYADKELSEGEVLSVGSMNFRVLSTPGHTPGSICLYCKEERLMLTGDTLFECGRGRCDFKFGSEEDMARSLRRLLSMDGDITFLSGHGGPSLIEMERGRVF